MRYEVQRQDHSKNPRLWFIYDTADKEIVTDVQGDVVYFDTLEEAEFVCDEMNYEDEEEDV